MSTSMGTSGHRRLDIQGLRAVAVVMVIVFHAGLPFPGGFVGVDVFFVISGFVITSMLQRERQANGRIRFGRFYARRFKRLLPALSVMVTVTLVLSVVVVSPVEIQLSTARTAVGAMLIAANFVIARGVGDYFGDVAQFNPLLNTWSLSVEEQFYLLFPALIVLGWWVAARRRALKVTPFVVVGLIALVSLTLLVLRSHAAVFGGLGWTVDFYSPVTRAWEFAAGALLALAVSGRTIAGSRLLSALGVVGAALLGASLFLITGAVPMPGAWTFLPVTASLLLLLAGSAQTAPTTRLLATQPLVWVGDRSYSLYLWHWPVIVFAAMLWPNRTWILVLAAAVAVVPALLAYRWVERPLRVRPISGRRWMTGLVAITMVPPLIIGLVMIVVTQRSYRLPAIAGLNATHVGTDRPCSAPPAAGPFVDCTWFADAPGAPIYLVGDSNAAHFGEAVIDAGKELRRPVTLMTAPGCPFIERPYVRVPLGVAVGEACHAYVESTLQWLAHQPPGLVVIANSHRWWKDPSLVPLEQAGMTVDPSATLPSPFVEPALQATVTSVIASGHQVLLVQSMPHFEEMPWSGDQPYAWNPWRCTIFTIVRGQCEQSMPLSYVEADQAASRASIARIAAATGASVADPARFFCNTTSCPTRVGEVDIYRDGSHLSVAASHLLAPLFAEAISSVG